MRTLLVFMLAAVAFAGCLDDSTPDEDDVPKVMFEAGPDSHPAYGWPTPASLPLWDETNVAGIPEDWRQPPAHVLPESTTEMSHQGSVSGVTDGSGIGIFGPYVYAGKWGGNHFQVIDISDPTNPRLAGSSTDFSARDIDTIAYPDGRLVAVGSTRSTPINVIDVTDPTDPFLITSFDTKGGNHNHQTVPGTPIVYNNPSNGAGGFNDIWDLSDPENPVHVKNFENGYGCHAMSFYINADEGKYRGYCAGIQVMQIWDVTDPKDPSVITTIDWPSLGVEGTGSVGIVSFAHLAMVNHDATVLIGGDETGGGAAPGCDAYVNAAGRTVSGPLGNLWFWDISDEKDPVLKSGISPGAQDQRGSCTAHFGGIIEDRNQLVMAYYTVGVILVDFNDLDNPYIVDTWTPQNEDQACTLCGTWDAQYYRGYVFTGDIDRGVDVLTLV